MQERSEADSAIWSCPQCCYLAKGAKRPSHTTNTKKFDRIPFDPCNSIKRFDLCPFHQKNSTYLQPPNISGPKGPRGTRGNGDICEARFMLCIIPILMVLSFFFSSRILQTGILQTGLNQLVENQKQNQISTGRFGMKNLPKLLVLFLPKRLWRNVLFPWKPVNSYVCLKIPVVFCGGQLDRCLSFWSFATKNGLKLLYFDAFIAVYIDMLKSCLKHLCYCSILTIYQISQILWLSSNSVFWPHF